MSIPLSSDNLGIGFQFGEGHPCIYFVATTALLANCGGDDFEPDKSNPDGGGSSGASGTAGTTGAGGTSGSSGTAGQGTGGGSGSTAKDPNGTACTQGSSCESGYCVDGVCCETACAGECETCAADDAKGECTPHASGSDPESECTGEATCADGKQTSPACDGAGSCAMLETECGDYACGANTCNSSCSTSADCASTAWCDGTECKPKKAGGEACTAAEQCAGGYCEGGYCCASACASPMSCSTGTCLCNGKACTGGATCITWYLDGDGDGFGVNNAGFNTLGCSNTPPTIGGVPGASKVGDCDDANKDAFPGQTKWFDVPRLGGSYDYDCDGVQTKRYDAVSGSCSSCGVLTAGVCTTCLGGTTPVGYGYNCKANCGGPSASQGFKTSVAPNCGVAGTLWSCTAASGSCTTFNESSTTNFKQQCH